MGVIYIIKNTVNYKIYIGQTKNKLDKRWKSHKSSYRSFINGSYGKCSALYNAFRKYGLDNFVIISFRICIDDELDSLETFYIKIFGSLSPNGYNLREGGNTSKHSKESIKKMSQAKIGINNPNFGKPRSDEFKRILSIKKSGENHHYFGKKLEPEHIKKLSESHKKDGLSEKLPMYLVYVKARPENYCSEGYAIVNHPNAKSKYFTSKKQTLEEKLNLAKQYLNQINDTGSTTGRKSV